MRGIQDRKIKIYKQEQRRRNIMKARRKRELRRNILVISIILFALVVTKLSLYANSDSGHSDYVKQKNPEKVVTEESTTDDIKYNIGTPKKRTKEEVKEKLKKFAKKDERMNYVYKNRAGYPDDMLSALVNTPEMVDFVRGYLDAPSRVSGGITKSEKKKKYPLFNQWDTRWAYARYGDSNIGIAGCGPTCLSMVIFSLTRNEEATPDRIAEFSEDNGCYIDGVGTAWTLMTAAASEYDVSAYSISLSEITMKNQLNEGNLIICAVGPGDFTTEGHFIVIYGYDKDGFMVNDPNSVARSNRRYAFEQLKSEIKSLWAYSY